jgi:hypothetical protein
VTVTGAISTLFLMYIVDLKLASIIHNPPTIERSGPVLGGLSGSRGAMGRCGASTLGLLANEK